VPISFRGGFYGGLAIALCVGLYLIWLWQPERQVRRHTENLFRAIERKDWEAVADFIGNDYHDHWATIERVFSNAYAKAFDMCAVHESSDRT
jgi:hypothetical protein